MIDSSQYSLKLRNEYMRFLLKLLNKKYFVSLAPIARSLGMTPNYIRDLANSRINFNDERLSLLEGFLEDLYEGILITDIPQDEEEFKLFINELPKSEAYKYYVSKL